MALFKIKKGLKANLPSTYNEGYCYFTTDDGKMYIDTTSSSSGRVCLNAATADKLSVNAGSLTQPIYFSNGVPTKTSYTLGASVPSGAKFTDTTYTKATTSKDGLLSKEDKLKLDYTNITYATCDTAADTVEKIVSIVGNTAWQLQQGAIIMVKFTASNTAAAPTLNVNGTGAKAIYYNDAIVTSSSSTYGGYAGRVTTYAYDGTNWVWLSNSYDANSDTKVTQNAAITTAGEYPVALAYSTSTSKVTNVLNKTSTLKYNPSTKILTAPTFKGDLDGTATNATNDEDGNNITDTYETKANAITGLSVSGKTITYTKGDGTTGTLTTQDTNTTSFTITATATDDDVVVLTGTNGTNKVTFDAKHAKKGPSAGYTSGNTITSISGSAGKGTIKIPQLTVDAYGHVTAAADENVTITMPTLPGAAGTSLGLVKSGGDVTISSGTITVNDDSHNHVISNIDNLQTNLDNKLSLSGGNMKGHIYLTGAKTTSSTGNTSQIIFGTPESEHVAISSNEDMIVINPSSASTANQILLKLGDKSSFPSGITANITGNLTGTASKATADASGNTITSTYETKTDAAAKLEEAKAYADTAVANLVDTAPEALNTLNELAAALGDDANFATTVSTNIGKKANSSITITAGNGLTGGGTLAANRTLAVGAGTGISVSANAVSLATVAGLTAGTYGPSANVSGSNNATMNVPEITVDTYGRVTKVTNRVYTAKNTTYSNFVKSGSGAKAGLVPAPSTTAGTTKYLREDGTWTAPPNTNYYHTRDYSTGLKISTGTGVKDMYVPEGTTNTLGVVKQHTSNDCTSYTSDSGATTPAAVKKAFGLFNAVSASKVLHSLSVNGKSFDGSSDITVGTISTSYGGTGATTLRGARNNLLYLAPTIKTNANDTTAKWGELGPGTISFYSTAAQLIDQPAQYGLLFNINNNSSEVHQMWFTQASGSIWHRGGNASGWNGTWREVLDSTNYNTYAPTKTGTGASGTWGISISGNAATATKATKDGSGNTITSKYVTLDTAQTISGTKTMTGSLKVSGRYSENGDDEGIIVGFANNGFAGLCLGGPSQARSVFYFKNDGTNPFWRYNNGSASYDISHPSKSGTIALTSDLAGYLKLSGGTMTGEIKTSFKSSVAMGSYQAAATTIPNLVKEVRYSNGCMGSVSIDTAYTASNGGTIAAGWYNFIYSPHRSGGNSGDNHQYGNLILMGMTDNFGCWNIRVSGGSISTSKRIWLAGDSVTGAVWNDYAEYRESDCEEFGYVLMENGDDTLSKTIERLSHFAGVSSDTWGFSQGETDKAKTPIAVAGRVLVYPYQDRNNYKPGDCVCAAPGGTVDIMTREEVREWPDRIVGTVSCVPDYEEWGSGEGADRDPIKVNGRIWIKVK